MRGSIEKVAEDLPDGARAIADVGDPPGQQTHGLGNTKTSSQGISGVTEQREGKVVTSCKASVAHRVISADPPNNGTQFLKFGVAVSKTAGLQCAAWGVVLWIEKENQTASVQLIG